MTHQPTPPVAAIKPHKMTAHCHTRVDNYYWLRERDDPEVLAYLEAENDYTQAMMAHTKALQQKLYEEMVGRIQETDLTVPVKKGDYYYYSRTEEGKQYNIYCRKRGSLEAAEEVLLDLNVHAEGQRYLQLGIYRVSPDHRLLAYSLDTSGAENFIIYFKDLETGELLPDQIPQTFYAAEWANDSRTLFYTVQDAAWRSYKLFRHTLGQEGEDALIHHEPDELYNVFLGKTKDEAYLVFTVSSKETAEVHVLDANAPTADSRIIHPRQKDMLYQVEHHSGTFYIVTNEDAPNRKVMTAPADNPAKKEWQEFIPHRQDVVIEEVEPFAGHLVIHGRENGLKSLRILNLHTREWQPVPADEPIYTFLPGDNPEFKTAWFRYTYTSLTTPETVFDYHMDTGERRLRKQKPVLGGYDPADYQSERLVATAEDGTRIPISLVYKKGLVVRDGRTPCLLYGYGSYGASMDPTFHSNRLSLLDRGFVYAIAHIRGGEEMGRAWYDQGKFLNKKNTFTDFIACARHLIAEQYTSPDRLAITGRSAGGLLIGAAVTMAPELFKAAVAGVPFVDVITTMFDPTIPLTVPEYEEWGNPNDRAFYEYMLTYSPYDNVTAQTYPNLLVTAGLNDPRVQYWEPAKWVARLRAQQTGNNRLLLKTHMGAGHFNSSGRYDYLKDVAFEYAFLLDTLGMSE